MRGNEKNMKFLKYDSPFMTVFRKVVDYFLLGILWVVACIPVITAGAATAATLMTAELSVRVDEGRIVKPFWLHFKAEFKQATILWLIQIVVWAVLAFYAVLVYKAEMVFFLKILSFVAISLIFMWSQLWIAYESKFTDNVKTVMVNCLRIMLGNMGTSVLLMFLAAVMLLGSCVAMVLFQPILLIIPAVYIFLQTLILRRLFNKLVPPVETEAIPEELEEIEE